MQSIRFQGQARRWWNGTPIHDSAELMDIFVSQIEDVICFIELGWPRFKIDLDIPDHHVRTYCLRFSLSMGNSMRIQPARLEFDLRKDRDSGYSFLRIATTPSIVFKGK